MMNYFAFMLTIEDVGISSTAGYLPARGGAAGAAAPCGLHRVRGRALRRRNRKAGGLSGMRHGRAGLCGGEAELRAASDFFVEASFDELAGKL